MHELRALLLLHACMARFLKLRPWQAMAPQAGWGWLCACCAHGAAYHHTGHGAGCNPPCCP